MTDQELDNKVDVIRITTMNSDLMRNTIPVASVSNAYTVALTLAGNWDNVLAGEIPANALVRIYRSANSNVTVTLTKQEEVTY